MKYVICFFIFILFYVDLIAQNQQKIDSLETLLKNPKEDTIKGKVYQAMGVYLYQSGKIDEATIYFQKAYDLFSKFNHLTGKAAAVNGLGGMLINKGNVKDAIPKLEEGLLIAKQLNNLEQIGATSLNLASIYINSAEYDKGKILLKDAIEVCEKLKNYGQKSNVLNQLSRASFATGQFEEAKEYALKSVSSALKSSDDGFIGRAYQTLAVYFMGVSARDSALYYTQLALNYGEKSNDKFTQRLALRTLGSIYANYGNYTLALEYFLKDLNLADKMNVSNSTAELFINLSTIYYFIADFENAIKYADKGLEIAINTKDKLQEGNYYNDMAMIKKEQKNISEAIKNIDKSIAIFKVIKNDNGLSNSINTKAMIYRDNNMKDSALILFKNALTIADKINDKELIANNCNAIGNIYFQLNQPDSAMKYENRSLRIATDIKSLKLLKRVYESLSQIYFVNGDYKNALENHKKFKEINDSIFNSDNTRKITQLQMQYDFDKKDLQQKIEAERKDNEIKVLNLEKGVQLERIDKQNAILSTQILKNAQHQNEIDLLNKEKLIEKLQLNKNAAELKQQKLQNIAKANELTIANRDKKIQEEELKSEIVIRNISLGALALLSIIAFLLLNQYRISKKTNRIIENQKMLAEEQRERAEQSEKFKSRFLANMSHEIRTPMNAVMGMTNLLLKSKVDDQQLKYLSAIQKSSKNLLVIINDILDLSKVEAGKMEFEKIDFRLTDAIETVYNTLVFKAEEKGLKFNTNIDNNIPDVLIGDPVRLNQILINIGGNAIKFTEKGSVNIDVSLKNIEINTFNLVFVISDTGIGIEKDKVEKIFDGFNQADKSTYRKFGGTGLGLNISRQLTELQGGSVKVESIIGIGTKFIVELPFTIGSSQTLEEVKKSLDINLIKRMGVLNILLAEDNDFNQIVAVDTLRLLVPGIRVDVANNGREAVAMIEKEDYDLVLMDVNMPEMNGLEATQHIRKNLPKAKNGLKIIAMTASITKSEIDSCFQSGMDDYVPKPFEQDELIAKIAKLTLS